MKNRRGSRCLTATAPVLIPRFKKKFQRSCVELQRDKTVFVFSKMGVDLEDFPQLVKSARIVLTMVSLCFIPREYGVRVCTPYFQCRIRHHIGIMKNIALIRCRIQFVYQLLW